MWHRQAERHDYSYNNACTACYSDVLLKITHVKVMTEDTTRQASAFSIKALAGIGQATTLFLRPKSSVTNYLWWWLADDILQRLMVGDGEYGCKTLVGQAQEYHEAAQCHPHNFEPPRLVVLFTGQVLPELSTALDAVNVCCESLDNVVNGTSTLFQYSTIPSSLCLPSSGQRCSQGLI